MAKVCWIILHCILQASTLVAASDIWCYCNDGECVNKGYTCHSDIGRCFSQLSYEATESTRSRHGCAETLPIRDRSMCESEGDIIKTKNGPDEEWPLLMCCKENMCNYQESMDIDIYVDTKVNGSVHKGDKGESVYTNGGPESRGRPGDAYWPDNSNNMGISQRDLWFKAAVIAVPIAGGFILILLVLLAVRMLRTDNRRQRHLMHIRHQRSLTKAQLYVADHFYHNETECLKNSGVTPHCGSGGKIYHGNGCVVNGNHPFRDIHHDVTSCQQLQQHSNVYKDVSVKLDKNGYEKMRPWSDSSTTSTTHDEAGSVNSVVLWNGSDPPAKPPNRASNV